MNLPERDWHLLKSVHAAALERYCRRVLDESAHIVQDTGPSHARYLRLFDLIRERDSSIAEAFNDLRRSTAVQRLAAMILLGVVTDEEVSQFSAQTRESATNLAELWRPTK